MSAAAITTALRPWRRRFWLQHAVAWTLRGLVAGLGTATLALLAARFVLWADALWWAGGLALAGPLAGLLYALATPPSMARTALRVDRLLGLADRQATAWELRNASGVFTALQRQDALRSLEGRSVSAVTLEPGRRLLGATLAALAAMALLALLPNPMDRILAERQEFQERIVKAKEEVRQAREELAESGPRLSAEKRETLETALKELEARLAQAKDKPEALAALSQAEGALQQLREPGQSRALQGVASAFGTVPAGAGVAQALQSGNAEALGKALETLAEQIDALSPEERDALMAAIQQAANATAGVNGLPGALREAARALGFGDVKFGDLEALLAELQEAAGAEQTVASVLSAIKDTRAAMSGITIASAGGLGADSGSTGEGNGSGAGDGSGSGEGNGGSSNGDGGSRSGGSGSGGTGIGSGGGQGGSGAGNAPGARRGETTGRLAANKETVFVPSQGQGGLPGVSVGTAPGTVPGDLRPYNEVIGTYAVQARDHMERSPVPEGYKDLVRRYFAELEE